MILWLIKSILLMHISLMFCREGLLSSYLCLSHYSPNTTVKRKRRNPLLPILHKSIDTSTIQDVPVRKILTLAALHPHFKVQPAFQVPTNSRYFYSSTQVGTQSVVCLSGLELTVKYTQTPFHFFGTYLLFTFYKNSVRTVPVQPQLSSWISRGFTFIILMALVSG